MNERPNFQHAIRELENGIRRLEIIYKRQFKTVENFPERYFEQRYEMLNELNTLKDMQSGWRA